MPLKDQTTRSSNRTFLGPFFDRRVPRSAVSCIVVRDCMFKYDIFHRYAYGCCGGALWWHITYNTEEKLHIVPFEIPNVLVRRAQNECDPYDLYDPQCLRRLQLPRGIPTKRLHHTEQPTNQLSENFATHKYTSWIKSSVVKREHPSLWPIPCAVHICRLRKPLRKRLSILGIDKFLARSETEVLMLALSRQIY